MMEDETQSHIIVEYERTIEDIIEFNLFHTLHSPSIRRRTLIIHIGAALLIFIGGLAALYVLTPRDEVLLYYCSYPFLIIGSIGSFYFFEHSTRREIIQGIRSASREGNNDAMLGHHVISLTPENIFAKTRGGEAKLNWSSIDRVAQNDKYVFLYTSSINAIVIPKSAFSADKSLPEFLNYVDAHLETKN